MNSLKLPQINFILNKDEIKPNKELGPCAFDCLTKINKSSLLYLNGCSFVPFLTNVSPTPSTPSEQTTTTSFLTSEESPKQNKPLYTNDYTFISPSSLSSTSTSPLSSPTSSASPSLFSRKRKTETCYYQESEKSHKLFKNQKSSPSQFFYGVLKLDTSVGHQTSLPSPTSISSVSASSSPIFSCPPALFKNLKKGSEKVLKLSSPQEDHTSISNKEEEESDEETKQSGAQDEKRNKSRKVTINVCNLCPDKKIFKRREHLNRHMLTHTGERPFTCHVANCGKSFNRVDNLSQHLRSHARRKEITPEELALAKKKTEVSNSICFCDETLSVTVNNSKKNTI